VYLVDEFIQVKISPDRVNCCPTFHNKKHINFFMGTWSSMEMINAFWNVLNIQLFLKVLVKDVNTVPHWVLFILTVYAFWIFQHSFTPVITAFDRLCKKRFPFQWFILNCLVMHFTFYPLCNLTHQETKYMFVIRYRSVTYRRSHNYINSIPRI